VFTTRYRSVPLRRIPFAASVKQNLEDVSTWPFSLLLLAVSVVLGVICRHELKEIYAAYQAGTLFLSAEELADRRKQLAACNLDAVVQASNAAHRRGHQRRRK
jgi:hypothetical protein